MSFASFMHHTVIAKNPTDVVDRQGNKTLGSAFTEKVRFERKYQMIIGPERESIPIHGKFIAGPDSQIQVDAQISYNGELYRVLQRDDAPGRNGAIHHYEMLCQLWNFG